MRKLVATAALVASPFLLLASAICGGTAVQGHAHDYAVWGWRVFSIGVACVVLGTVLLVAEEEI